MPDAQADREGEGRKNDVGNTRTQLMSMSRLSNLSRAMFMLCMCIYIVWYVQVQVQRVSCCLRGDGRAYWGQVTMSRTHISCHSSVYFLTTLYFAFIASLLTRAFPLLLLQLLFHELGSLVVSHIVPWVVPRVVSLVVVDVVVVCCSCPRATEVYPGKDLACTTWVSSP